MGWRERCTPFLVEIADHAADVLKTDLGLDPERAAHGGYLIMRRIAEAVGGAAVYIPTADSIERHERDEAIWREYTGNNNVHALARKYGVTTIHLYRLIKRLRAEEAEKRQGKLDL
jgi:Mor family transcriptional regulator